MTTDCGPDPAFAASPSSQSSLSRPDGLQSGVGFAADAALVAAAPKLYWALSGLVGAIMDGASDDDIYLIAKHAGREALALAGSQGGNAQKRDRRG